MAEDLRSWVSGLDELFGRQAGVMPMSNEYWFDEASLRRAAAQADESVASLGRHTESLLGAIRDSSRTAWGTGLIGMAMVGVNNLLGQACEHLHGNLGKVGEGIRLMADTGHTSEDASRIDSAPEKSDGDNPSPRA